MFEFEKILSYIADEQCALVIGPEVMRFDGKPMNIFIRDKLYDQFKNEVKHYYPNEGLFLFPSDYGSVKSDVAKALKNECFKMASLPGYNEGLLKNLAMIPFHLIISINPDTFLSNTFYKYGIKHRFSHFRKGERPSDEVAAPTRDEPLIYNIAGSVLEDESLILDYDDLFSLISSSLGTAGLPNELQKSLDKMRTYIFIGFPFEKWYTHMMLRILCGKTSYRKYAGPHQINPDTHTFLVNQFKIDFWEPDGQDFWDAFISAARTYKDPDPQKDGQPFLRELREDPLAPEEANIMREIQNAQYVRALQMLSAYAKGTAFENDAIQNSARYQTIIQNQAKLDSRDFLPALYQISDAVIQLARQIAQAK